MVSNHIIPMCDDRAMVTSRYSQPGYITSPGDKENDVPSFLKVVATLTKMEMVLYCLGYFLFYVPCYLFMFVMYLRLHCTLYNPAHSCPAGGADGVYGGGA